MTVEIVNLATERDARLRKEADTASQSHLATQFEALAGLRRPTEDYWPVQTLIVVSDRSGD